MAVFPPIGLDRVPRAQQTRKTFNEGIDAQKDKVAKNALSFFAEIPFILYSLRTSRDEAGGWKAMIIVALKAAIPGLVLGLLGILPQAIANKSINACEPEESPTRLSEIVFRVIKGVTACGLFIAGTTFAMNAHQRTASAFKKAVIQSAYVIGSSPLLRPTTLQISLYSPFEKAERKSQETGTLHPLALATKFMHGLWLLSSWKGSPILSMAQHNVLSSVVDISCKSLLEPELV